MPFARPGPRARRSPAKAPRRARLAITLAGMALTAASVACSATEFDGRVYKNGELAFRVGAIPAGWRRIHADNTLLAFRDDAENTTVALNGRCGKDGDDVPLQALTHHLFLHFTDRQVLSQEMESLDGRDALRTVIVAELDGVPKRFTVIVLKKDGCVYDFMRISAGNDAVDEDFERFVRGFATLG